MFLRNGNVVTDPCLTQLLLTKLIFFYEYCTYSLGILMRYVIIVNRRLLAMLCDQCMQRARVVKYCFRNVLVFRRFTVEVRLNYVLLDLA